MRGRIARCVSGRGTEREWEEKADVVVAGAEIWRGGMAGWREGGWRLCCGGGFWGGLVEVLVDGRHLMGWCCFWGMQDDRSFEMELGLELGLEPDSEPELNLGKGSKTMPEH